MSVSRKKISVHPLIAQLEQEIADKELERNRIRVEAIVQLRKDGLSLNTIGQEVGLTRGRVHQILAVHDAGAKAGNQ